MLKLFSISLVCSCLLFISNSVQAQDNVQESDKEKATGKNAEPWKIEQLPPDAVMSPSKTTPIDPSGKSILEQKQSWMGYLISADSINECKSQSDYSAFLSKYDRQTALLPVSREKGYLLYANNKWYTLDTHGNELAVKTIEGSIKTKGFYVTVSGTIKGNTIIVDKLAEITDSPETNF